MRRGNSVWPWHEVVDGYERHVGSATARTAARRVVPVEARSAGTRVWDVDQREYLDCSGSGVFPLGHGHPAVLEALHRQLDRHSVATGTLLSGELADAARRLAAICPPGLDRVHFGCTGAETVRTARRLAWALGRRRVITMDGGYLAMTLGGAVTGGPRGVGRDQGAAARTTGDQVRPEVVTVPYGDVPAVRRALAQDGGGGCCVVVEPVQAEGGVRVPPPGYLREVAEACHRTGALLVVDEIHTGLGRLGAWWGCAVEGVTPDLLLTGEGLGGGCVPVSAVVGTEEVFAPMGRDPLLHASTFCGYPLGMAAVTATLEVMDREYVPARAEHLGKRLLDGLSCAVRPVVPYQVRGVRGQGLLLGVELADAHLAGRFTQGLLDRRVLAGQCLGDSAVVRLCPPASLTDAEVDWVVNAVGEAAAALARDLRYAW